jgi:hypothetical protein
MNNGTLSTAVRSGRNVARWGALGLAVLMVLLHGPIACRAADSDKDEDRAKTGAAKDATQAKGGGEAKGAEGSGEEHPGEPHTVKLESAEQAHLGVVVSKLAAAPPPSGTTTIARVLDPGPLLTLDGELASAIAAQNASRAEAERTRKLFSEDRTASARAVETANAQAQADQERVESARRRLTLEWGDGIMSMTPEKRTALLNDLASVRAELVRVELPVGAMTPKTGSHLELHVAADSKPIDATVLGLLPAADPRLQTSGVLAELRGADANLPIGRMLTATIPAQSNATPGVLVPRGALLRDDSKVWVYVQTATESFIRREVVGYVPEPDGWFVREGFAPGERVVSTGADVLHAVESPAEGAD